MHPPVEHVGERRQRHRGPGMPGVRLLHRIHRQCPDRVDRALLDLRVGGHAREDNRPLPLGHGSPDRIRAPQGALRRAALRRRLVQGRAPRPARARRPERRGQDDAAARADRRDRARGRRARLGEGRARRAARPAAAAARRLHAPRIRALGRLGPRSRPSASCAGWRRRWQAAIMRPRRSGATARRRPGSSTPAATAGATTPRRSCAGSASPTPTSTAVSRPSPAESSPAPRSHARSPAGPTCSCSTSRPTTSTWSRWSGSSRSSSTIDAAVILVAHDRWFLESVATSVLELEGGQLDLLPRQVARLAAGEGGAARDAGEVRGAPGRGHRPARALRRPLPLRDEVAAGAGEAEADRADRGRARRGAACRPPHARLRVPEARAQRADGRRGRGLRPRRGLEAAARRTRSSCSSAASTSR